MIMCGQCRFWFEAGESEMGQCRIHAPSLIQIQVGIREDSEEDRWAVWPETFFEWSCGEGEEPHA